MKRKKHLKIILIAVVVGLFFGVSAFLLRGWIRDDAMRWVITAVYAEPVERHYKEDFAAVDKKLEDFGFVFKAFPYDDGERCGAFGYELLSATYSCTIGGWSDNAKSLSPEFIARWQKESPELEHDLLWDGWVKQWNERQPIDELFRDRPGELTSIGVNYSKQHGPITCTLSIWYNPPADDPYWGHVPADFNASQDCARYIDVFGGY